MTAVRPPAGAAATPAQRAVGWGAAMVYPAPMEISLERIGELPPAFEPMRAAAAEEGFHFLDRLAERWQGGAYDGDAHACVLGALVDGEFAAIGAQTADDYDPDPDHRRLRHFYVAPLWRRSGVGRALAASLTSEAFRIAPILHLRATHAVSVAFWDAMGFARVTRPDRTHEKVRP